MEWNDLLAKGGFDPHRVLVFRHRPTEPGLQRVLPWLAAERPEVFNAYQQTQVDRVERAMGAASHVASFIGHAAGRAVFVGLYAVGASKPLTREDYWRIPAYREMQGYGMKGWPEDDLRTSLLWFDLEETGFYARWKGRLIVEWPPPERSWWRRAHRNTIPVAAILEDNALAPAMPPWDQVVLRWDELCALPSAWRAALSQWRGIYYIFDASAGRGYVGSTCGCENLLGRWLDYACSEHGGNALLRRRDPRHFRFTILQLLAPDLEPEQVQAVEAGWKERLHTRAPYGLNAN